MTQEVNEITINGVVYVNKETMATTNLVVNTENLPMVMIRTYSAGVHYGYLKRKEYTPAGIVVELINARRVYQWAGAMTLSQLSMEGTKKPELCKFPCEVSSIELLAIEIIPITDKALKTLNKVDIWEI